MKNAIPKPAIFALLALAVLVLGFIFMKSGGESAPQVDPSKIPDYSKMSPQEISAAHEATPGNGAGKPAEDGHGRG